MQGWVKLHRSIMESSTFRKLNAIQQLITIYIILNANHEDGVWYDKYKDIEVPVKRGQLITSRNKIANEWFAGEKDITERKVRTTLERLEKYGFLTKQTTSGYTLLTINNYGVYQSKGNENDQANDHEPTRHRPSDDQAMTTNKNDKNDKNDKEDITTTTTGDAVIFYQENFGIAGPYEQDAILNWINDSGEEMVIEAMKRSIKRNKKNWGYVEKILKDWARKKITTIEQANAEEIEFQNQYSNVRQFKPKQSIGNYDPTKDRF